MRLHNVGEPFLNVVIETGARKGSVHFISVCYSLTMVLLP